MESTEVEGPPGKLLYYLNISSEMIKQIVHILENFLISAFEDVASTAGKGFKPGAFQEGECLGQTPRGNCLACSPSALAEGTWEDVLQARC